MSRRELRENIFKLLFLRGFHQEEEMPEQMALYFGEMDELEEKDRVYMEEKFTKTAELTEELDQVINGVSSGWKTTRMSKVDLTILRLAVYELKYDEEVPVKVAINEAVELAKKFGQDESPSFINGILGAVAREL
ncbi:MAG: transcription antitermination factor NusB [Ruminococcus sp.]|jgi:N utilization substance protein B